MDICKLETAARVRKVETAGENRSVILSSYIEHLGARDLAARLKLNAVRRHDIEHAEAPDILGRVMAKRELAIVARAADKLHRRIREELAAEEAKRIPPSRRQARR